jgi:flagellar hook-length control protein FliK
MAVVMPEIPAGSDPVPGAVQKADAPVAGVPSKALDEIIAAAKTQAKPVPAAAATTAVTAAATTAATTTAAAMTATTAAATTATASVATAQTAAVATAPAATAAAAHGSLANLAAMIQAARGTITVAAPSKPDTGGDVRSDAKTVNATGAGKTVPVPADAQPQKVDPVLNAGNASQESSSQRLPDAVSDKIAAPQSAPPSAPQVQPQPGATPAQIAAIIAPSTSATVSPVAQSATPRTAADLPDANLQPNIGALAAAIAAKSAAGSRTFDIRLDPPELGRVDVHLTVDKDGKVQAVMLADRPHTLELLQRGSHDLERALKDAGLSLSNNSLNFSLKGEGRQGDGGGASMARARSLTSAVVARAEAANASEINFGTASGRLDIRV